MVGTAATRGLHRSSTSKVNWEGKGPSSPLGGAIVDDHGLLMVIGGSFKYIYNTYAPLWQKGYIWGANVVLKVVALGDGIEISATLGQNGMEVGVMLGWIYNEMCLGMCLGMRQF